MAPPIASADLPTRAEAVYVVIGEDPVAQHVLPEAWLAAVRVEPVPLTRRRR